MDSAASVSSVLSRLVTMFVHLSFDDSDLVEDRGTYVLRRKEIIPIIDFNHDFTNIWCDVGRLAMRVAFDSCAELLDIVHINDLAAVESSAYLLKFDSVHGKIL